MPVIESDMIAPVRIIKMTNDISVEQDDHLAIEEPLEIRLSFDEQGLKQRSIAVTMRTPSNDHELAAGFLFTEGIINQREQIMDINSTALNVIVVRLSEHTAPALQKSER